MRKLNQVLIIDDDEVNNLFCSIVIEHSGITGEVHCCTNGPEAFDYLANCIQSGKTVPDLIFLDINMPLMSGLDFLKEYSLKNYNTQLPTKIAMLSSSILESDINFTMNYDFVIDYIEKPLSEEALDRVLEKINLGKKQK